MDFRLSALGSQWRVLSRSDLVWLAFGKSFGYQMDDRQTVRTDRAKAGRPLERVMVVVCERGAGWRPEEG